MMNDPPIELSDLHRYSTRDESHCSHSKFFHLAVNEICNILKKAYFCLIRYLYRRFANKADDNLLKSDYRCVEYKP